jgi:hypothetical protein
MCQHSSAASPLSSARPTPHSARSIGWRFLALKLAVALSLSRPRPQASAAPPVKASPSKNADGKKKLKRKTDDDDDDDDEGGFIDDSAMDEDEDEHVAHVASKVTPPHPHPPTHPPTHTHTYTHTHTRRSNSEPPSDSIRCVLFRSHRPRASAQSTYVAPSFATSHISYVHSTHQVRLGKGCDSVVDVTVQCAVTPTPHPSTIH